MEAVEAEESVRGVKGMGHLVGKNGKGNGRAPIGYGSPALRDNDAYVPGHGDERYSVLGYDIELDIKLAGNHVQGKAVLRAVAGAAPLAPFALDLHALKVARLSVDGRPPAKFTHRGSRLVITPKTPIAAGDEFTISVAYSGNPRQMRGPDGLAGWEELEDGLIVASQPHGSPTWFPCNDRPGDKATYRFEVTTDNDYQVVTNGMLLGTRRKSSRTTWQFEQREPMASYLATLQIGRYERLELPPAEAAATPATPVAVYYPQGQRRALVSGPMLKQQRMVAEFSRLFGPYPFARYDVVVTDDELEIPLEAQTLSIFGRNFLPQTWENERLVAHELAHQWFGNSLTIGQWRDIWLHEGFACYSEWLWSESSGGRTAADHAREHYAGLAGKPQDFALADPSPRLMFDDRVYKRGAATLHALRMEVGDQVFFELLRGWCNRHRYGTVSTEGFIDHVTEGSSVQRDWFTPWLYEPALPPLPG